MPRKERASGGADRSSGLVNSCDTQVFMPLKQRMEQGSTENLEESSKAEHFHTAPQVQFKRAYLNL